MLLPQKNVSASGGSSSLMLAQAGIADPGSARRDSARRCRPAACGRTTARCRPASRPAARPPHSSRRSAWRPEHKRGGAARQRRTRQRSGARRIAPRRRASRSPSSSASVALWVAAANAVRSEQAEALPSSERIVANAQRGTSPAPPARQKMSVSRTLAIHGRVVVQGQHPDGASSRAADGPAPGTQHERNDPDRHRATARSRRARSPAVPARPETGHRPSNGWHSSVPSYQRAK